MQLNSIKKKKTAKKAKPFLISQNQYNPTHRHQKN